MTPDLLYQRERATAIAHALRFKRWLLLHVAAHGIPLDNVMVPVLLLTVYVEATLLLRVKYPATRPVECPDEDEPEYWRPRNAEEAAEVGLYMPRKWPRKPAPATLPGCQADGGTCTGLRRYGERFCSQHRRAELARMRSV